MSTAHLPPPEPPPRRWTLPDWSKTTWLMVVALVMIVILTLIAVANNPALAEKWVEALFGALRGFLPAGA